MSGDSNYKSSLSHGILWDRLLRLECGSVPSSKRSGALAQKSQAVSTVVEELFFRLVKDVEIGAFFEIEKRKIPKFATWLD
jgi:hypothetical protein